MIRKTSPRLPGYDYHKSGKYFVTIRAKQDNFGRIINESMILNELGQIVKQQWKWIETNFTYIKLDEFCVMPDHTHGIIEILPSTQKTKSLSNIIGAFKTTSSKQIHNIGFSNFKWQRSFHDQIINNNESLRNIRNYIINNAILHTRKNLYVRNREKISSFR
ncbi:hypothetical protein GF391_00820 [Candidatus Uhrbacteria bacterium]|nr:hypothetical protein [Candidatus Uhrbacteria bacterium]